MGLFKGEKIKDGKNIHTRTDPFEGEEMSFAFFSTFFYICFSPSRQST
jgi:hypothetical protein